MASGAEVAFLADPLRPLSRDSGAERPLLNLTSMGGGLDYLSLAWMRIANTMLPPFIIEQIRRRETEEQKRRDAVQPRLELPIDAYPAPEVEDEADAGRGVVIIDL